MAAFSFRPFLTCVINRLLEAKYKRKIGTDRHTEGGSYAYAVKIASVGFSTAHLRRMKMDSRKVFSRRPIPLVTIALAMAVGAATTFGANIVISPQPPGSLNGASGVNGFPPTNGGNATGSAVAVASSSQSDNEATATGGNGGNGGSSTTTTHAGGSGGNASNGTAIA